MANKMKDIEKKEMKGIENDRNLGSKYYSSPAKAANSTTKFSEKENV